MGAGNVAQVFTHWTHLGHREARLLAYLALVSLDAGRPPVYFGGWADAARAIGLPVEANPQSAQRGLRNAIRALTTAGALAPSGKAHTGRRAEYALTLDPARSVVATGTTHGPRGRTITTWTVVDRATREPVDKGRRLWERRNPEFTERRNREFPQVEEPPVPEKRNPQFLPMKNEDPHQEYGEENIALDATSSTPASAQLRPAAVFLARTPDQGRAALADLLGDGEGLSEAEAVVLAARRAGWVPEAEDVPA